MATAFQNARTIFTHAPAFSLRKTALKAASFTATKSSFASAKTGLRAGPVATARSRVTVTVVAREAMWNPGREAPTYLDGSLPADYGFDPLALGEDPEDLKWYVQAELVHARFAMLGMAGIMGPLAATKVGISWPGAGVPWYKAGEYEYFAPAGVLFVVQMLFMGWAEARRYNDIKTPGSMSVDPLFTDNKLPDGSVGYPGGVFDPFGYASSPDLDKLKAKELANGRLAMVAILECYRQAIFQ